MQQNNINQISSNLIAIDIARGFAALSVFVYHYGVGSVLEKATGLQAFNFISTLGSVYAVPLFFTVSGFCILWSQLRQVQRQGNSSLNYKNYVWRRFWRIYPTYLVVLLFSCNVIPPLSTVVRSQKFFLLHIPLMYLRNLLWSDIRIGILRAIIWLFTELQSMKFFLASESAMLLSKVQT
jgi:peptidoglycan/LPS O-acetylase OafA/YrhL